ncbi:hypothetical protein [Corynebacterium stationis]|uniref:hypothetical protein n=1 Tax=Corynebacterium stationis TaxID=1705 RepID=UPI00241D985A|nr:hypothetical protein [Corynebacterium stationis]
MQRSAYPARLLKSSALLQMQALTTRQCADEDEQETMTRWKEQGTPEIIEDVDREAFMEKAHAYWEENLSPEELEVYNSIRSVK